MFFNKDHVLTIAPFNTLLTADSAKIVTATALSPRHHPRRGYEEITEFSVRASQPVLSQDRFSALVGYQDVLWASPDGSALVSSDPPGREDSERSRNIFGVLAGNRFTPIPRGAHTSNQVAW